MPHPSRLAGAIPVAAVVAPASLVGASAVARFLASRSFDTPWIAPDEMAYLLAGRAFWETGHLTLLGADAPFYGLYPLLAGLPLALFGTSAGLVVLQAVQALVVSSTAAIAYAWARPLAGARLALAAAALTAALPGLAYSGLAMTEAVFLPAGTLALWALARAIAEPTPARQLWAVGACVLAALVRLQGIVLFPVAVTAVVLAALLGRDREPVRRFVPPFVLLASIGAAWAGARLALGGSLTSPFGAYGTAVSGNYELLEAARWIFRHAGDVFLLVLGIPLVALGALVSAALAGRERDRRALALVAVAVASVLWFVVQVGVFASRYVEQLAERDLLVLAPPLFVCLAAWLGRRMERPQPATAIAAGLVAVPAVLLPVRALVTPRAVPDALMSVPWLRLSEGVSATMLETVWVLVAAGVVAMAVLLPRRLAPLLLAAPLIGLAAASVAASAEISARSRAESEATTGSASSSWIDESAGREPVVYLYEGQPDWTDVWRTAFWNRSLATVATLPGELPGPVPGRVVVAPKFDGRLLRTDGRPLPQRLIVVPRTVTVQGELVREIAQGPGRQGLALWRTRGAPTLSTWTTGLMANGDIVGPVRVQVFACGPGRLELTLIGKDGTPLVVYLDGREVARITVVPRGLGNLAVPAPAAARGDTRCVYELLSTGLVGSTRIAFVRA